MGGPDAEREVSMCSGREVATALREYGRYQVFEQIIDCPSIEEFEQWPGDVIVPVLHGQWGEGGPLQETLEQLGRPYVGSQPGPAALAMDKMATKRVLAYEGVKTPLAMEIGPHDHCRIDPPLVMKPIDDGSSVDIRICMTVEEVVEARRQLHPNRARLMAEQYIAGRELTVGIVNGEVLPVIEVVPSVAFYDYQAKYARDDTRYIVDPELSQRVARECAAASMIAWNRIGCRDVARIDFRLDENDELWFLEINTMPGFTTHSLVPMAARAAGLDMPRLCSSLVEAALSRKRESAAAPLAACRSSATAG